MSEPSSRQAAMAPDPCCELGLWPPPGLLWEALPAECRCRQRPSRLSVLVGLWSQWGGHPIPQEAGSLRNYPQQYQKAPSHTSSGSEGAWLGGPHVMVKPLPPPCHNSRWLPSSSPLPSGVPVIPGYQALWSPDVAAQPPNSASLPFAISPGDLPASDSCFFRRLPQPAMMMKGVPEMISS